MDALFGVTNIPSGIWIDEDGVIVRPHESAVPPPVMRPDQNGELQPWGMGGRFGFDANRYADMVRDWVRKGADSEYALAPEEVIARSHPQTREVSEAAAHFELAQHLWRQEGFSERALSTSPGPTRLQPDNITYKRQAYSQYRMAMTDEPDDRTRFMQSPTEGEDVAIRVRLHCRHGRHPDRKSAPGRRDGVALRAAPGSRLRGCLPWPACVRVDGSGEALDVVGYSVGERSGQAPSVDRSQMWSSTTAAARGCC